MKERERRDSPRKGCTVPLRFRVLASGGAEGAYEERFSGESTVTAEPGERSGLEALQALSVAEGKALNLSERGIYFVSPENVNVGQTLEIYFTLPSELTGRAAEQVKCRAHVVHVDNGGNTRGIGASVEAFRPITAGRNWSN